MSKELEQKAREYAEWACRYIHTKKDIEAKFLEALQLKQKEIDELKTANVLNTIAEGYHLYPHPKEQQSTIASLQKEVEKLQTELSKMGKDVFGEICGDILQTHEKDETIASLQERIKELEILNRSDRRTLQERCERLESAAFEFVEWNKKYPSSKIYGEGSIRKIAAELDDICARTNQALTETKGGE